jgi:hypothetical protein
MAFTRSVAEQSGGDPPADIQLHVMPTVGHRIHDTAHDEAAAWLRQRLLSNKAPPK